MRCGIIIKVLNRSHLVIINATNLKMSITLMSLYSLGKLLLKFEFNNVLFFIDLIDSIIETSVIAVQYHCHLYPISGFINSPLKMSTLVGDFINSMMTTFYLFVNKLFQITRLRVIKEKLF